MNNQWGNVSLLLMLVSSNAFADQHSLPDPSRAYAHWDCAALATLSEELEREGEKHFIAGYELLRAMLLAYNEGDLTEEYWSKVPVGISWYLSGGPSIDFQLGGLWASFLERRYDETLPDIDSDWNTMKQLQAGSVLNLYNSSNCHLIADE